MEYRPLDITLISAKDLKDVNKFTTMDVYAVVSINGDPRTQQKTPVDKDCGIQPKWNYNMKFTIDESAAQLNALTIVVKLISDRTMGDKEIGEVHLPVKELLDQSSKADGKDPHNVTYEVRLRNGKAKGSLNLAYKFGDKFSAAAAPPPPVSVDAATKKLNGSDPVTAYPAGQSGAYPGFAPPPPAPGAYPPPQYYPQHPPPQHGYGGYPYHQPPPQHGYGGYPYHQPPPPGYGYGYPPQQGGYGFVQQPMKPKKNKMGGGGLGLGLGAGLLGGLLVGDMMGDVSEAAAYDEGYMDGMDGF
ncbi:hypothetical protein ACFE04_006335 [Oxalis oulophora]